MSQKDTISALKRVPMLAGCSRSELSYLADHSRTENVDAGHPIIAEGAPSTGVGVVLVGKVTVSRSGQQIATIGPGDTFGEIGAILGSERNATITAATPVQILMVPTAALKGAVDEVPGFGWHLLNAVASRLTEEETH